MKKLSILTGVFLTLALFNANQANACSYFIDQAKKSAELEKVALAGLGNAKIISSSVSDFSYFESKPTSMCPEELTYKAAVTASYKDGQSTCTVLLSVEKVEAWGDEMGNDAYRVIGRKAATCK